MLSVKNVVITLCLFVFCGCGVWRPLPTHGGGKRLDEEQRIIAGAIRTALEQVDVKELKGKNVTIEITAMSHDGGGQITTPGLNYISGGWDDSSYEYVAPNSRDYDRAGWDVNFNYSLKPNLRSTVFRSQSDMDYFTSALIMKLRLSDVNISPKAGAVTLYVLMDILGTNLATEDFILVWKETLKATCEFTYFAVENNKLLFNPRAAAAVSTYAENTSLIYFWNDNMFEMKSSAPTGFANYCVSTPDEIGTITAEEPQSEELSAAETGKKKNADIEQKLQLADTYISSKKYEAAQNIINDILKTNPNYPGLDAVMARLQDERNQTQEAAEKAARKKVNE